MALFSGTALWAAPRLENKEPVDTLNFYLVKGLIIDEESRAPLAFATLSIEETNIATVSNSNGEFSLKIPKVNSGNKVMISHIGYEKKFIPMPDFLTKGEKKIELKMVTVQLVEVSIFPSDPNLLIRAVMNRRDENYVTDPTRMTAFYRETIKKGWTYVSLSEAVVTVHKNPYNSMREDNVKLNIGRKSTNYEKLDTLAFKLQGGPYTAVMLDIMKDPYLLFDEEMIEYYDFKINNLTRIDDRLVYVLDFAQKPSVNLPLFFGKLYVDTQNLAITKAIFNLNTKDRNKVAAMFIRKKPLGAKVYPTEASYLVTYRQNKEGKWYFGYSRGQASFRVNWKRKWFNTNYHTTIEMAVTDWKITDEKSFKGSDRLKINAIMEDEVAGFSNESFWGDYNVIQPEQPIESAIRKIQRKMETLP
jgi:hypothetical protein